LHVLFSIHLILVLKNRFNYQTNLGINEIATKLGYDDPYYFSRLFKKVQGCSPAHHRDRIING